MKSEVFTPSNDRLKEDVQLLKEWMSKEPHLPKIDSEEWLEMFLHHNKYKVEKTKTKIDNYYSFRNKYPAVLKNRDPLGSDVALIRTVCNLTIANKLTKDGGRIFFCRFHPDPNLLDIHTFLKRGSMLLDLFYLLRDKHSYCAVIVDCQYLSYQHFLKVLPGMKAGTDIFFNAYSDRFKAHHLINLPAGMEKVVSLFKNFLPKKIANRLTIHSPPADVCNIIDEDVVCSDFGGGGPSLSVYDEYSTKLLEEQREWFLEQDNLCTNEKLRRKQQNKIMKMLRFWS